MTMTVYTIVGLLLLFCLFGEATFITGASGTKFKGDKIRDFDDASKVLNALSKNILKRHSLHPVAIDFGPKPAANCTLWAVVTTIFVPSESILRLAALNRQGFCVVIVGDNKTPENLYRSLIKTSSNTYFISISDCDNSKFHFIRQIPQNHFGRKNIGYFYALAYGAERIWDFDDDNDLLDTNWLFEQLKTTTYRVRTVAPRSNVYNPYPTMGAPYLPSWPRGFPLENVKENRSGAEPAKRFWETSIPASDVAVIQSLAQHDPDVDALYRLTQPLPFNFSNDQYGSDLNLLIPPHVFTPFNGQATLWSRRAGWGMLLPIGVHGRVSDIWRSYINKRLYDEVGLHLLFSPAKVIQIRNSHDYIADMSSEDALYMKTRALVDFLEQWKPSSEHFPLAILELYIALFERDYIPIEDVHLASAYLQALLKIGYQFPKMISDHVRNPLLVAGVFSAHGMLQNRNAIRKTFLQKMPEQMKFVFVLDQCSTLECHNELMEYQDVVFLPTKKENAGEKGFRWLEYNSFLYPKSVIVKADVDIFACPDVILRRITNLQDSGFLLNLYWGNGHAGVDRRVFVDALTGVSLGPMDEMFVGFGPSLVRSIVDVVDYTPSFETGVTMDKYVEEHQKRGLPLSCISDANVLLPSSDLPFTTDLCDKTIAIYHPFTQ